MHDHISIAYNSKRSTGIKLFLVYLKAIYEKFIGNIIG